MTGGHNTTAGKLSQSEFLELMDMKLARGMCWAWEEYELLIAKCESPIERMLFGEMYGELLRAEGRGGFVPFLSDWRIVPQYHVGPYRLDFAVGYFHSPHQHIKDPFAEDTAVKFVVECDGHDFHEKTKQQAGRDKARDRFLTAAGWRVMRFTGSEVYADPLKCAGEVYDAIRGAI